MTNKFDSRKGVLWSMDLKYNEFDDKCKYPLYEIVDEGKFYSIKYHGVSEIKIMFNLEEAKKWIRDQVEPYKIIDSAKEGSRQLYLRLRANRKFAY